MFCHITSQIEGEKYGDLLSKKGGSGFPHMVALDVDGEVLQLHQSARSIDGFQKTMDQATNTKAKLQSLPAQAATSPEAAAEYINLLFDLERLDKAQAEKLISQYTLADEAKKKLLSRVIQLEVNAVINSVRSRDPKVRSDAGKKLAAFLDKGFEPMGGQESLNFWWFILGHAEAEKNAPLFERGLAAFKKELGESPRYADFLKGQEAILAKIKNDGAEEKAEEKGKEETKGEQK